MTPFVPLVAMVGLVVIPVVTDSNSCLVKPSLAQVPTKAVGISKVRVHRGGPGGTEVVWGSLVAWYCSQLPCVCWALSGCVGRPLGCPLSLSPSVTHPSTCLGGCLEMVLL